MAHYTDWNFYADSAYGFHYFTDDNGNITHSFAADADEWTVLSLARGNYFAKDNAYFTDYDSRIVHTVNATAASVNLNGTLHKSKSTENSRLIVALSAIGKEPTAVGDWDLVEAYSANGFSWIKKQGINPDTDSRFIKNGNSVVDALLARYLEEEAMFQHVIGAGSNAMATDQSCYGLIAYDRFVNGKLRVVYFDSNENSDLTISGTEFPAEIFTIGFKLDEDMTAGTKLDFAISGMSMKLNSNSEDEASMIIVNTTNTGVSTYVALVDASIAMENFVNKSNFTIAGSSAAAVTFADANGDGVITKAATLAG